MPLKVNTYRFHLTSPTFWRSSDNRYTKPIPRLQLFGIATGQTFTKRLTTTFLARNCSTSSTVMQIATRLSAFICAFLVAVSAAQASLFSPFLSAIDVFSQIATNETSQNLRKRSSSCPTGYDACSGLGAPGLCCASNAICSADAAGHVACCPTGAACTGTISSIITGGTIAAGGTVEATSTSNGLATTTATTTTTTSGAGLVLASAASSTTGEATTGSTTQGFIIAASTTVATLGSGGVRSVHTVS